MTIFIKKYKIYDHNDVPANFQYIPVDDKAVSHLRKKI